MEKTMSVDFAKDMAAERARDEKLRLLGRRTIGARIFERRRRDRDRQILRIVYDHVHASESELKERLLEVLNGRDMAEPIEAEIDAELAKMK